MTDHRRVVTARLPADLMARMDEIAKRMERTKNWIIREAVAQWLAEEQRRFEMTLESIDDFNAGWTLSHEDVLERVAFRKQSTRQSVQSRRRVEAGIGYAPPGEAKHPQNPGSAGPTDVAPAREGAPF